MKFLLVFPRTVGDIVTQARFMRGLILLSQVHVSSFVILCGSHNLKTKSYAIFAKEDGSVTVQYILKVRTNLYAYDKLATIILMIGFLGINFV